MGGQLQNLNVAMFIDADNAPSRKIGDVLAELASFGSVSIRRAYGNWKNASLEPWGKVLHEHAIQPMQQFDLVKGLYAGIPEISVSPAPVPPRAHPGR